jgi:hypothetical protein
MNKQKQMKKEATIEIVKGNEVSNDRVEKLMDMISKLSAKIKKSEETLSTKLYIIEGGLETADEIIHFLENEAQWKFSEALGVIEAARQVKEAKKEITNGKTKELLIGSLPLEAIYYFLTKVEGKGIAYATTYVNSLLKPISDALGRSKSDREKHDQLVRDRGTLEAALDKGANIENEDKYVSEILAELETE